MQRVFVLSTDVRPLDPCHPARARRLLRAQKAAVYRHYPFTIILRGRAAAVSVIHSHTCKLDPGSRITGIAIVQDPSRKVVWAAELSHRGERVREALRRRHAQRRNRRQRHCRYRQPRFSNRKRPAGWLPPSMESRIANMVTWVRRLQRYAPVHALSLELVKFDTTRMQNPEVSGIQYQQGQLAGYEVREFLLEKWQRRCAYCGKEDLPLQVEHIVPRCRGGSDRVSNLTLACAMCNRLKDSRTAKEFGHPEIQLQAKQPLKHVAASNAMRWSLFRRLQDLSLPIEVGTGGRTKFNRIGLNLPKVHWIDAACVGRSGEQVSVSALHQPMRIRATGHGSRQMCRVDRHGFPRASAKSARRVRGFRTGDLVIAKVLKGKKAGTYVGRIAVRASAYFDIATADRVVKSIAWRWFVLVQRADGYAYARGERVTRAP